MKELHNAIRLLALSALPVLGALCVPDTYRLVPQEPRLSSRSDDGSKEKGELLCRKIAELCDQQYLYGGPPLNSEEESHLIIVVNRAYIAAYDPRYRNPAYVAFRYSPPAKFQHHRHRGHFIADERVENPVHHRDYTKSGYSRGHMAPSYGIGIYSGDEAERETFFLTNIVPQKQSLNNGVWKRIEIQEADHYTMQSGNLWIITGPVYKDPGNPPRLSAGIAVPDSFFRIQVRTIHNEADVQSFLVSHDASPKSPLRSMLSSVDRIEEETGLDFFPLLSDQMEKNLESRTPTTLWEDEQEKPKTHPEP